MPRALKSKKGAKSLKQALKDKVSSTQGGDAQAVVAEETEERARWGCEKCNSSSDPERVLVCDGPGCDMEIHTYCLTPPLAEVPEGAWFCPACCKHGTTTFLEETLQSVDDNWCEVLSKRGKYAPSIAYRRWLIRRQFSEAPFDYWDMSSSINLDPYSDVDENSSDIESHTIPLLPSELDPSNEGLLFCPVRLRIAIESENSVFIILSQNVK